MSRWTHVSGSIDISSSIFEDSPDGTYYIPFPKKQIRVLAPKEHTTWDGKKYTSYDIRETALPRALPHIKKAMKLFPEGEVGKVNYAVNQDKENFDSGGSCFNERELEAITDILLEKNKDRIAAEDLKDKDIFECLGAEIGWAESNNTVSLTIIDDIRYCSGLELLEAFDKAFKYITDKKMSLKIGSFKWIDDYISDRYIFEFYSAQYGPHMLRILDAETNTILASKTYDRKYNKETKKYEDVVVYSDNWEKVYKEVEKYGGY